MNHRQAVIAAISSLCITYGKEPSKELVDAYVIGLDGLTAKEIEVATASAIQKCKFFPKPVELRELADQREESLDSRAEKAFRSLSDSTSAIGGYKTVDFADPIINATVRSLGGWERVCQMECEEFDKWYRKDFLQVYRTYFKHPPGPEACCRLPGLHNRANGGPHKYDTIAEIPSPSELPRRLSVLRAQMEARHKAIEEASRLVEVHTKKVPGPELRELEPPKPLSDEEQRKAEDFARIVEDKRQPREGER